MSAWSEELEILLEKSLRACVAVASNFLDGGTSSLLGALGEAESRMETAISSTCRNGAGKPVEGRSRARWQYPG